MLKIVVGTLSVFTAASFCQGGGTFAWINPAGGSFHDAGNWSGGSVPGAADTATFDLAGSRTITGTGTVSLAGLQFLAGDTTMSFGGTRIDVITVDVGAAAAARSTVLMNAALQPSQALGAIVQLRNADYTVLAPSTSMGYRVSDGSTLTAAAAISYGSNGLIIDSGSSVYCTGVTIGGGGLFQSSGRIVLQNGGRLSLNGGSQTGGEIQAADSEIVSEGFTISGGTHSFVNSRLRVIPGPIVLNGQVLFDGATAGPVSGLTSITGGRTTFKNGVTVGSGGWLRVSNNAALDVGGGCTTWNVELRDQSTLYAAGNSRVGTPGGNGVQIGAGATVELALDALQLPASGPIRAEGLGGTLRVQVDHPNALALGQQIPLVVRTSAAGQFTTVDLPALDGGRALQVVQTPTSVYLEVIAGGSPCWTADFNGDGDIGTDQDIEAFFACLAGNCCAACGSTDFNSDGDFGTDQDIEAFFRILSGAPC